MLIGGFERLLVPPPRVRILACQRRTFWGPLRISSTVRAYSFESERRADRGRIDARVDDKQFDVKTPRQGRGLIGRLPPLDRCIIAHPRIDPGAGTVGALLLLPEGRAGLQVVHQKLGGLEGG